MRAHHALRVSLPGAPAGTGWRRLFTIAVLTALAVVGPTAAAYATDTVVSERPVTSVSDQGLLVRAHASADRLYPGASQNVSLLVTNRGAQDVTTIAVRHVDIIVTGAVGECGRSDFTMQTHDCLRHPDPRRDDPHARPARRHHHEERRPATAARACPCGWS